MLSTIRFASATFLARSGSRFDLTAPGPTIPLPALALPLPLATGVDADGGAPILLRIAASLAWISARLAAISIAALFAPLGGAGLDGGGT